MSGHVLRIATRGSNLALWQANFVAELLRSRNAGLEVELVRVSTTGDQIKATPLSQFGGVGVFTREVQNAVLDCRADLAVHSLKDLPTEPVAGIALAAVPERASMFDALVLPRDKTVANGLRDLPNGARIGTGSHRRQAQILHIRPDVQFLEVRGNVETRLRKLDEGDFDALVLAEAGLDRLGLSERISCRLGPPDLFPAVGQGALGIECRADDELVRTSLARLNDAATLAAVTAERQVLSKLRAGCHAPVGVAASIDGTQLQLEAVVLSRDGKQRLHSQFAGPLAQPASVGNEVADDLLRQGAGPLIDESRPGQIAPP